MCDPALKMGIAGHFRRVREAAISVRNPWAATLLHDIRKDRRDSGTVETSQINCAQRHAIPTECIPD